MKPTLEQKEITAFDLLVEELVVTLKSFDGNVYNYFSDQLNDFLKIYPGFCEEEVPLLAELAVSYRGSFESCFRLAYRDLKLSLIRGPRFGNALEALLVEMPGCGLASRLDIFGISAQVLYARAFRRAILDVAEEIIREKLFQRNQGAPGS